MNSTYEPTPEMLEVLEAVERAPRSKLLRPPLQLGRPSLGTETWTGGEPFLSSAERKLVRAYREEASEYLFYKGQLITSQVGFLQSSLIDHREVHRRAQRRLELFSLRGISSRKINRFLAQSPGSRVSSRPKAKEAQECFQTSFRLTPRHSRRVMLGIAYGGGGQFLAAKEVLDRALFEATNHSERYYALVNLGLIYWHNGQTVEARNVYLEACKFKATKNSIACAIVNEALLENWESVRVLAKASREYFDAPSEGNILESQTTLLSSHAALQPGRRIEVIPSALADDPLVRALVGPFWGKVDK